jgi:serine/threonine protein kinase
MPSSLRSDEWTASPESVDDFIGIRIHTQSRFVLKVYNFDLCATETTREKQRQRILRAADALHRLKSHPNIVEAHPPFPWQDNQIVLPVEWVDGYSLRGLLDSGTELELSRRLDIVHQIGAGLQHAHGQGVIHRDVRPDNVIVPHQGAVKLVNFDCARIEGDDDLQTISSQLGRHFDQRYVAPEVWVKPRDASRASDQYALGIIVFELLAGQPPYNRIQEVFEDKKLPQRPTELNPGLPSDVDEVVGRMCAFKPTERYKTLGEALEDIAIIF